MDQSFLAEEVPGQLFSFHALRLSRDDGDGERAYFSVTVVAKEAGGNLEQVLQEWVSLDPGHTVTLSTSFSQATQVVDARAFTVMFGSDASSGNEFEGKMLLYTRFTPEPGMPEVDVARLELNRDAFGVLPRLPKNGKSSDYTIKSTMMLDCGAADSEITFTVHPFTGWLRVLSSNMTSLVFEHPNYETVFTTDCLRGSALWVSSSLDAVFSWVSPTQVPSSSVVSVAPLLPPVPAPPLSGTVVLSAVVQGRLDFNLHRYVCTFVLLC